MGEPTQQDAALYEQAQARRKNGDLRGAVVLLEELIARCPDHPNALNLAGWILTRELLDEPASLDHGVRLLRRAVELFPLDLTPLANLVEALAKAGRCEEALEVTSAGLVRKPYWSAVWNLSGWLKALKLGRLDEGIADLERATSFDTLEADSRFNLGRALLLKGDDDAARENFRMSTERGSFRNHEAYLRLGELHEKKGWLRRALGSYRQAARLDGRREYSAVLDVAVNRVGNALLRSQRFFLHAEDEERRFQYLRENRHLLELKPLQPRTVAASAEAYRARVSDPNARAAADLIIEDMKAKALLPVHSDRSAHETLKVDPGARKLLEGYFAVWMRLYEQLLDQEEPGGDDQGPEAQLFRLGRQREWSQAADLLEGWERQSEQGITFRGWAGESLGDQARQAGDEQAAMRFYRLAEDAFADYASGSTSGGEGMARMLDVNRVREKLRG